MRPAHRFAGPWATPASVRELAIHPEADGAGTLLEQWCRMDPARSGLSIAIDAMPDKEAKIVFVRLRRARDGHAAQPQTIKDSAERVG